jgi:hypothetical protein
MACVNQEKVSGPPPLWPSLLICAVVAAWVDLGTIQRLQHADSLMYPMISLWHWTPFYWGQDRFGMLVPLLARPIGNPLANLLVQDFLNIFSGLAAFVLLARYMSRDAAYPALGILGAASFLAFVPPAYQAMYFIDACYGIWLALGLGGLIAVESRPGGVSVFRLACGLVMILLAHWVNFTTALILGPLVVSRLLFLGTARPRRPSFDPHPESSEARRVRAKMRGIGGSETTLALLLLATGVVVGWFLVRLSIERLTTPLDALAPSEWIAAWYGLLERQWESLSPQRLPAFLASATALGLATLAWPAARRQAPMAWRTADALVLSAAVIWLYTGTRLWVRLNGYTFRYLIPSVLMVQAAILTIGVAPLYHAAGPNARKGLNAIAVAAMFGGATLSFGYPSLSGVRSEFDRKFGAMTDDLIDARCTHLAGEYYRVWPAVFHANVVLYERGEDRILWAVTGRSEATAHLWRAVPPDQVRVAIPIGDREAAKLLKDFDFPPLREWERRRTVRVFRR